MAQLIITALGADRPGIVGDLTGKLVEAASNILDSRMVNLRGQFAVIMLIEVTADKVTALKTALPEFAKASGLQLQMVDAVEEAAIVKGLPFKLSSYSMDQPGIVHRITDLLKSHKINIEDLTATQHSGAFVGHEIFVMEAKLTVPPEVSVRELRKQLDVLGGEINCDIDLEPA